LHIWKVYSIFIIQPILIKFYFEIDWVASVSSMLTHFLYLLRVWR